MTPTRIRVDGVAPYDVVVGTDLSGELASLLPGADQVALLAPTALVPQARRVLGALQTTGRQAHLVELPDGEAAKELGVAAACWDRFGAMRLSRSDAVVALGGGATTDLAGFVAATWLRGVRVVHLPTTLLGMVDAAVGGKTGINTAAGKNLVGAFHPPAGVLCDLDALDTLPREEYLSGLAEVVKCGFIADPVILDLVESDAWSHTAELVERSVRVKAGVVAADLTEQGGREVLNYGHTLAHAIENVEHYSWRHGDAVSVGLCYAAQIGVLAGRLDEATARRHRDILAGLGLPVTYRAKAWPVLHEAMRVDKKTRGSRLRLVVLDGLARPAILADPDPDLLASAYQAVAQ